MTITSFDLDALQAGFQLNTPLGTMLVRSRCETHSGLVVLFDEFALKFRKPLDLGFLDYSTTERRWEALSTEFKLGRQLSAEVYLGVWGVRGCVATLDSEMSAEPVLVMKRLAKSARMDVLIADADVGFDVISPALVALASFHGKTAVDRRVDGWGSTANTLHAWEVNFSEMTTGADDIPFSPMEYEDLRRSTDCWFQANRGVFEARIAEGRIRDCHGDLRPEHIYLVDPVAFIDPLEFSTALRFADVGAEIGYLAMECDMLGRSNLSEEIVGQYIEMAQDTSLATVVGFFKRYRALVMAKVEWIRARQLDGPEQTVHNKRARRYAELALGYKLEQ